MPNKSYIFITFTVILIFTSLACLLSSCDQENTPDNSSIIPVPATGEPVTINFTVGERYFGTNEVTVRSTTQPTNPSEGWYSPPVGELEGVSKWELEGGVYLSASLQEKIPAVTLRAAAPLAPDRKVRVAAYDITSIPNDTILLTYTDYEVDAGLNLVPYGTPPMTVPSGNIYFVAYSFNDDADMDAFADTIADIGSRDLLWGETEVTVGPGNTNVYILLDHLFSKINFEAETDFTPPRNINDIYDARYDHTFPALTVRNGDLTPKPPSPTDTIHVVWQSTNPSPTWTSEDHFVYTSGDPPAVTIDGVLLDGIPYSGPWTPNYITPLVVGHEYILKVRFTPPTLNVSTNSLRFAERVSGSGVQQYVTVTTNHPSGWDYSVSGDFTVTRSGNTLTVYPDANPCFAPRTATITVTAGALIETITVTQDPGTWRYDYNTGNYQIFTTLCSGTYQIELWGAGSRYSVGGGYVKGEFSVGPTEVVKAGQDLYLYVGGQGISGTGPGGTYHIISGGWNGGGDAFNYTADTNSGSGGGATDIRYFSTTPTSAELTWNNATGLRSRIMVAGGGGGYVGAFNITLGAGGGLTGITCSVTYPDPALPTAIIYTAPGGTQIAGGSLGGSFGQGGNGGTASGSNPSFPVLAHRAGGGGGYYGGGYNTLAGGGGSSFISGHAGCNAVNSSGGHTNQPNHYSGLVFTNTVMIDGAGRGWTNVVGGLTPMPNPNGGFYASGAGHISDGVVIITYLGP